MNDMDKIILNTLLITTALAIPVWMAWRTTNKRPWLGGWILVVGLLALPFGLTAWLHPEWLNHPVAGSIKNLVVLPALLSLCALGGGLVYLVAPLAIALLLCFGETFRDIEWRRDDTDEYEGLHPDPDLQESMYGNGTIYREQLREGFERGNENAW